MTDERLEQILRQALTTEISDDEIVVKKKGQRNRKKILRTIVAIAACCILVITGSISIEYFGEKNSNLFTVHVMAKELNEGETVYMADYTSNRFGSTGFGDGKAGYVVTMPLTCQGENIESITYSIKNAAFHLTEMGDRIIVEAKTYDGDITEIGFNGSGDGTPKETSSGNNYVSSYTVNYDKQTSDTTWINICGNHELSEAEYKSTFGEYDANKMAKMYDKLLEDVVITCTVTFKDGTTDKKDIIVGAQTMRKSVFETISGNREKRKETMGETDGDAEDLVLCYLKFELR